MLKALRPFLAAAIAMSLFGCASSFAPDFRGECASSDRRPWVLAQIPHGEEMSNVRSVLDAPQDKEEMQCDHYSVESWFKLPAGDLMLCQSAGPLRRAPSGSWRQFVRAGQQWRIVGSGSWGCILVTS